MMFGHFSALLVPDEHNPESVKETNHCMIKNRGINGIRKPRCRTTRVPGPTETGPASPPRSAWQKVSELHIRSPIRFTHLVSVFQISGGASSGVCAQGFGVCCTCECESARDSQHFSKQTSLLSLSPNPFPSPALLRLVHVLQLLLPRAEFDHVAELALLLHHLPVLHERLQDSPRL